MAKKKYSKNFERDWEFYLRVKDTYDFAGKNIPDIPYGETGLNAKDCFHKFDSYGKVFPCKEPDLLREIFICKASINLHIKLWAAGKADGTFVKEDWEQVKKDGDFPEWVVDAFHQQWYKKWRETKTNDYK